jgi:hypothetical protein
VDVTGILPIPGTTKCWQEATSTNLGLPIASVAALLDMTGDGRADRFGTMGLQVNVGATMSASLGGALRSKPRIRRRL